MRTMCFLSGLLMGAWWQGLGLKKAFDLDISLWGWGLLAIAFTAIMFYLVWEDKRVF